MNKDDIYLGALLHDLGKFFERSKQYYFSARYTDIQYSHPKYSAFLLDVLHKEVNFFKKYSEAIIGIAGYHHQPRNLAEKIVQLADWLASGERMADKENKSFYLNVPLKSIFCDIHVNYVSDKPPGEMAYLLAPLSFESIFPTADAENDKALYREMVKNFSGDLRKIETKKALLHLLEKYLSFVPAQTTGFIADVSLYDHLKITSAIAVCLYHQAAEGKLSETDIDRIREELKSGTVADKNFILIHADLSGIQNYIFNVASKGAAKSLKGRSVYLVLLMEAIADYIIEELQLEQTNILYNGGGNFYILAPAVFEEKIKSLREKITEMLLQIHKGKLFCNIGYIHFTSDKFAHFQNEWRKVAGETAKIKQHKISAVWKTNFELLFNPADISNNRYCHICHSEEHLEYDTEKEMDICQFCKSFESLTAQVKRCSYVIEKHSTQGLEAQNVKNWQEALRCFGKEYIFSDNFPGKADEDIYALNNFNDDQTLLFRSGALNLPFISDFDQLQEGKRLAYLKLDVDNLGKIFQKGIEPASISRISALSRMMRLFFEGYLPYVIQERKQFRDEIYVVFSGGDDTFAIGKPQVMVKFAQYLRKRFTEYVAGNPQVTFTAAIGIYGYKHPLIKAAQFTDELLEEAKNFRTPAEIAENSLPFKNKVFIFGEVFNWNELDYLIEIQELIVKLVHQTGKRSIIRKVLNSTKGFKPLLEQSGKGKLNMQKVWRLSYYLRDLKDDKNELIRIYENMWLHNFYKKKENSISNHQIITVAAKLADLETREKIK